MWLVAMFDLPMTEKDQKLEYIHFRKGLLSRGFTMIQYSVYAKFCSDRKSANTHLKYVRGILPPEGEIRVLHVTEKQFAEMEIFFAKKKRKPEDPPEQLMLF